MISPKTSAFRNFGVKKLKILKFRDSHFVERVILHLCKYIGLFVQFALKLISFNVNMRKSIVEPTRRLTYLGLDIDLSQRRIMVSPLTQRRVSRAIGLVPNRGVLFAQKVAGYVNFIRTVARLPLQIISTILARDPALKQWARDGMLDHPWVFSSNDYHERFRAHPTPLYSDATPTQVGWHDGQTGLALELPRPLPIYLAELLAGLLASVIARPASTVWVDNSAALINLHKGRCPRQWLPWVIPIFRDRRVSFRYIPSQLNMADGPSRAPLS